MNSSGQMQVTEVLIILKVIIFVIMVLFHLGCFFLLFVSILIPIILFNLYLSSHVILNKETAIVIS